MLLLCSCSANNNTNTDNPPENPGSDIQQNESQLSNRAIDSKTYKFSQEYLTGNFSLSIRTSGEDDESMDIEYAYSDKNVFCDIVSSDGHFIQIMKDGFYYTLLPEDKIYISTPVADDTVIEMPIFQNYDELANETYTVGTTVVSTDNGDVMLEYEAFSSAPEVKYCFDGDNLVYIVTEDEGASSICEIKNISKDVDNNLFEIPSDYEEFSSTPEK